MAETLIVKADKRNAGGTGSARRLRHTGLIPAVVYGGDNAPQSIQVNAHAFGMLVQHHGNNFLADLVVDDAKPMKVLLKDVQHDPQNGAILHVDFIEISMTETLTLSLPIELTGAPAGLVKGGVLEQLVLEIEVSCLPSDMVETIPVDVSALEIGDHLTVADVQLPPGLEVETDADVAVAAVAAPRTAEEEEEAEAEEGAEAGEEGEVGEEGAGVEAAGDETTES